MSSALANKINQIKAQQENPEETFDQIQFLQLLKELEPEYVLTDEEIYGIFDFTDSTKQGRLGQAEVFRVLDMILASEEEDKKGEEPKRGSIAYIRHSIRVQNNRLSSNTINEIDIDTISELKHIYSICEGNKGYASLDQITEFIGNFKQLSSGSLGQLLKIFNCVKDSERNIVTREAFSNLMSKLEKAILNQFVEDNNDNDNINFELNVGSKEEIPEQKRVVDSVYEQSEMASDSEDDHSEEDDQQGKNFNQDLVQEVLLVIQKVDEAVETLKNKATATSIKGAQSILGEVIGICYHLEKNLKSTGENMKELKHKLHERKNVEELLNAKIATLELNNKQNEEIFQQLQNEYDTLFDANRALESQMRVFQHIDDDFKEKNNEIVRLERKVKDIENLNLEIQNKMKTCEYDRDIAIQNYRDLDSLFKKQEERINEGEDQIRASQQFKETSSFEIEALKIELKNALAKKELVEKEKLGFEAVINELRENLINNKEFLDALKLEKNDLQSKFNKLQKELDALKSESSKPRMSISKRISIRNDNSAIERFSIGQGLDYSMTNFRQIPEINEEDDTEEVKNLPEEVLKTSMKKEVQPIEEKEEREEREEQLTNNTSPEKNNIESPVKNPSPTEEIKRKPTTAIDLRQLSQDYLGLKHTWLIKKILQKHKERDNDGICFSDYMYRINSKEKRERRVLFITSEALYSLRQRKSSYTVIRRIPLEKISRITVSKSSAGLCAIHVHNEYDYLIDTYKRLNLLLFLQNVLRFKGLKPLSIAYEQSFMVKNRKATELKKIDQYSKAVVNPELQSTYKNAQKFGELFVKTGGLFNTWAVHFFILTEVGFVCFNKAGNSKPIDFIPILGYLIIDKGIVTYGKYAFKIKFPHSDFEITLAASSEIEKKDWIQKIKMIQEKAVLES